MPLVNLTGHDINIISHQTGLIAIIPPSGDVCRVQEKIDPEPIEIEGVRVFRQLWGDIVNLKEPVYNKDNIPGHGEFLNYYIVSSLVKNAAPYRGDLIVPANIIYDNDGKIIGCRNFVR